MITKVFGHEKEIDEFLLTLKSRDSKIPGFGILVQNSNSADEVTGYSRCIAISRNNASLFLCEKQSVVKILLVD
jgi:hypothetical protein